MVRGRKAGVGFPSAGRLGPPVRPRAIGGEDLLAPEGANLGPRNISKKSSQVDKPLAGIVSIKNYYIH